MQTVWIMFCQLPKKLADQDLHCLPSSLCYFDCQILFDNSIALNGYFYSKFCVKRPLSKRPKTGAQTNRLMQVKSIAECSKGSILQNFRPSLSYHFSLRSLFCLFLSGLYTQVLLNLLFHLASKQVFNLIPAILRAAEHQ